MRRYRWQVARHHIASRPPHRHQQRSARPAPPPHRPQQQLLASHQADPLARDDNRRTSGSSQLMRARLPGACPLARPKCSRLAPTHASPRILTMAHIRPPGCASNVAQPPGDRNTTPRRNCTKKITQKYRQRNWWSVTDCRWNELLYIPATS